MICTEIKHLIFNLFITPNIITKQSQQTNPLMLLTPLFPPNKRVFSCWWYLVNLPPFTPVLHRKLNGATNHSRTFSVLMGNGMCELSGESY